MGKTITEKILAKHTGKEVKPGEIINATIDLVMCHDVTTPPAITMLEKKGITKVFDKSKIVVTPDHFVPNKDIKSAELAKRLRDWVNKNDIENYYEVGCHGVCHAILPEQGHVLPGTTIICGDSHTCTHGALGAFSTGVGSTDLAAALATGKLWFKVPETIKFVINGTLQKGVYSKDIILKIISDIGVDGALYKAMEFTGETIDNLSVEARMTITNMAIEAGGKTGIIAPDKKTIDYVKQRTNKKFEIIKSDKDASYLEIKEYNVSSLEPMVAFPSLPSNGKTAKQAEKMNIKIDQAYLGSCTNGRRHAYQKQQQKNYSEINMKKLLIAMTAVMAMASTAASAHTWDGDAWAAKQMTLYQNMTKCEKLSDTDFTLFMKTCSPTDIAIDQVASLDALMAALNAHPSGSSVDQFIAEHFKDALQANKAMVSMDVIALGLKLMQRRMELYKAMIQRDREIKKAEEALGLHGA